MVVRQVVEARTTTIHHHPPPLTTTHYHPTCIHAFASWGVGGVSAAHAAYSRSSSPLVLPLRMHHTTRYMAPEVVLGSYDSRADIYAFGLLMWETFHERLLFGELEPITAMVRTHARCLIRTLPTKVRVLSSHYAANALAMGYRCARRWARARRSACQTAARSMGRSSAHAGTMTRRNGRLRWRL